MPYFPNATQCNQWTFKCNNGQCIPFWWKCDGSNDCSDHSDELECDPETTPHIIDPDNEENDPSYQPECAQDKFLCPGSADCIWEAWLCDHENDCPGGEDESQEICANRPVCSKDMFRYVNVFDKNFIQKACFNVIISSRVISIFPILMNICLLSFRYIFKKDFKSGGNAFP